MSGVAAARMAAYRTLCIARERDAYVRELVNSGAAQEVLGHLKAEDRAFARKLALGVCATAGTLDEALDRYIAKPAKVAPGVRDALRISAYELLFLDKPAHVVVSQGVELVRSRAKSAAGLANAVLRRVAENAQAFMAESVPHRCGIPAWLFDRLVGELGEERALAFAQSCLEPAPVYVANVPMWVSDRKAADALATAGLLTEPCGGIPGAWRALDAAKVPSCSLVEQSQAVVADLAAQAVAFLAAPEPGDRVLEVGSGRGTKTILMAGHAHRAQGAARIWALDTHAYKAKLAAKRLEAARVVGVQQVTGDACKLDELAANRELIRSRRKKEGIITAAIVGYTNAGKSTLLNRLTDAGVLSVFVRRVSLNGAVIYHILCDFFRHSDGGQQGYCHQYADQQGQYPFYRFSFHCAFSSPVW